MWDKRADTIICAASLFKAEATRPVLAESEITPVDTFYLRNHGRIPDIETGRWRLTMSGLFERELTSHFADLDNRLSVHNVVAIWRQAHLEPT
ncbi:hypothetical protein [Rhodococcus wratislaviensis]|nr:hypothetical protein [Rhodococcus wratislaviensis]